MKDLKSNVVVTNVKSVVPDSDHVERIVVFLASCQRYPYPYIYIYIYLAFMLSLFSVIYS